MNSKLLFTVFLLNVCCLVQSRPVDDSYEEYPVDSYSDSDYDSNAYDYDSNGYDYSYSEEDIDKTVYFLCPLEKNIISLDFVCDGVLDCIGGSDEDEDFCKDFNKSKTVVPTPAVVEPPLVNPSENEVVDDYVDRALCGDDQFQCSSLPDLCIPLSSKCDKFVDCPEAEDELNCEGTNVANLDTSPVATTTEPDLEIKTQEISETTSDSAWQNPTTVIATSSSTLSTRSHLRPNDATKASQSSASATTQIPSTRTLSSKPNRTSPNKTSSLYCDLNSEFECRTHPGDCIPRVLLCDGYEDCNDGSDEENCGCAAHEYRCISGPCIDAALRCNGNNDCGDFSDEFIGCPVVPDLGEDLATTKSITQQESNEDENDPEISDSKNSLTTASSHNSASHIRLCQRNICKNGGTCLLRANKEFFCHCRKGFLGSSCEISTSCTSGNCGNSSDGLHKRSLSLILIISSLILFITRSSL